MENKLELLSFEEAAAVASTHDLAMKSLVITTVANAQDIEKLQERQSATEKELAHLRQMVRVAFRQSGVDFDKAGAFISSRVPTLDVPVVAETVLTANQKLKPSPSGVIGVPSGSSAGDGE